MAKGKSAKSEESIEVKDGREFPFFTIDNALISEYGAQIGVYGIAVYNVLAMYAGQSSKSWPSYQKIADTLGIGRTKTIETIALLVELGLVAKKNRFNESGDKTSNLYTLTDQAAWGSAPHEPPSTQHEPPSSPCVPPLVRHTNHGGTQGEHKQDSLNNTQLEQDTRGRARASAPPPSPPPSLPDADVEFMADAPMPKPPRASKPNKPALVDGKVPAGTGDKPARVYHEIHPVDDERCQLNDAQRKAIESTVTDLPLWREVVTAWALAGFKPNNIRGQLEWYRDPSRFRKDNSHHASNSGRNGAHSPTNGSYQPPEAAAFTQEQWREWLANRPPEEVPPY